MRAIRLAVELERDLDPAAAERAETEANRWIKRLRQARIDGETFRDRFTCRGDSLWWFAEIYLHKRRVVVEALRARYALEALGAAARAQWDLTGLGPVSGEVARQLGSRLAAGLIGTPDPLSRLRQRTKAAFHTAAALADRLRPHPPPRLPRGGIAAFVHSAFASAEASDESYVGPVLRELSARAGADGLALVGLGPRTNFRVRRWRDRVREFVSPLSSALAVTPIEAFAGWRELASSRGQWNTRRAVVRALEGSADLRDMSKLEVLDLWPLLRPELEGIATLQFPWSVRAMDEAAAALERLEPRVAVTYAEAGGWGRALVLEARRRGIPTAALQHGFIYRHWLNYLHEPDEAGPSPGNASDIGFPYPTRTLIFDGYAREHLERHGGFQPAMLDVTGSARLDRIVASARALTDADRAALRRSVGATDSQSVVTVAAKHAQMGNAFRALVDAVKERSDVVLVVKPHPAEGPDAYLLDARGAANVHVAPAAADLGALTALSAAIVTVNSTAAIEAIALDVPALVVNLPNNLSPFVDAGVMSGAPLERIGPALEGLLYDREMRARLAATRRGFAERYGIRADGAAAPRAADLIIGLARNH